MPVSYETAKDIRFVYTDKKQNVWMAPRSGKKIIRFSPATEEAGNMKAHEYLISYPGEVKHTINCLLELWDGRMLASGYTGFFVQKGQSSFESLNRHHRNKPALLNTWSMYQIEKDQVLLGTKDLGLFVFNLQKETVDQITLVDEDGSVLKEPFAIWNMLQIAPGVYWFATSKGLFKAIRKSDLTYLMIPHPAFLNYSVWSYCKTGKGIIWFGTIENGLVALNAQGQVVRTIGLKEGLPSLTICGIVEDDSSQLWVSTASAISRIRFESDSVGIRSFDVLDGLPVEGFNYRAAVNGPQKNLFFTSKRGLVYFQPHHVQTTKKEAQLLIRKCLVSETDYTIENILDPVIELIPGNNSFSLEPALTDYGNPDKNRFYYQLSGIDAGWKNSSGKHPFIHYSSLPPGHYVLHVRAENPDGQSAMNELMIPVHVQPFFWQKAGFKLMVGGLVIALISLMIFLAINRLRLRRHLLKSEISSLRLQMNPHFIFNSLNSIQDYIFHNEKQLAASYLARFARLIRSIMENAGKNSISLREEVAFLNLYLELESLRFSHFDYSIVIDPDIDAEEYSIPPMLLQPLVENALKHGLSGKQTDLRLVLKFEKRGEGILCSIADNGIGMEQSRKKDSHQSMGLHVVKERLLVLNQLQGTKYALLIPKLNTHFPGMGTVITLEL
ncbi:MAG: sensor histidine kinase [Bacteroidia bacterium]